MREYKTKNMNLQLFAGDTITDLTGTSWELNTSINVSQSFYYFLNFSNDTLLGSFDSISVSVSSENSPNKVLRAPVASVKNLYYGPTRVYSQIDGWLGSYKIISITGGTDATNTDLISWLQANATQIQTGYSSTINLTNCACNKSDETGLSGSYSATVTANSGYYLSSVTSTLGTAIISTDKHTATIEITDVTENFTITSVGTAILYKNVELSPNANGVIDYTTVLLPKAMSDSSKQNALTTEQMTAVNSGITSTLVGQIGTNQSNISGIQELIPSQATSENQLADKSFVNSSIATNTANFIGTFANITALNNYVGTITNNDYANIVNQELDFATTTEMNNYTKALLTNYDYAWVVNGTKYDLYRFDIETQTWGIRATSISKGDVTLINAYNRYTYNGNLSQWAWNYTINTSGFTAQQWAAINSGATAEQITKIGSSALTTTATNLSDAVNELNSGLTNVDKIFIATIQTTYNEITQALNDGKIIFSNVLDKYWQLTNKDTHNYEFTLMQGGQYLLRTRINDTTGWWGYYTNTEVEKLSNKVTSLSNASTDTQYPSAKLLYDQLLLKQATLESGTSIKTINGESVLGSGNIQIQDEKGIENYEVIDRPNAIPTATEWSPDFVQYNGELYKKVSTGVIPSRVTDLTGTSWIIDSTNCPASYGMFGIDGYINDDPTDDFSNIEIGYTYIIVGLERYEPQENSVLLGTNTLTTQTKITFTSDTLNTGTGTTEELVYWLSRHATMQNAATYSYVLVGSGGGGAQDLTSNAAGTLDSTAWGNLKTNHYVEISNPTMTGLDSSYEFVNIKLSINSVNQFVKLAKNTTNKYSGLFFIEESTNLYEITVYYNGTNIILRCATVK